MGNLLKGYVILKLLPFSHCGFTSRILVFLNLLFGLQLGTYNPIANKDGTKEITVNTERMHYWLASGAQPSDRVAWMLGMLGVLPKAPVRQSTKYLVPKSLQKKA